MFCSNCGREIPNGAKFCGFCGTPVAAQLATAGETEVLKPKEDTFGQTENLSEKAAEPVAENVTEPVAGPMDNFGQTEDLNASTPEVATPVATPAPAYETPAPAAPAAAPAPTYAPVNEAPAAPATPVYAPEYIPNQSYIPEEPKKKGKGGLIAGIAVATVAVIALVVGVVIFAGKNFENTIHKTFDKPKEYYSYVEKQNLDAMTEGLGSEGVKTLIEQVKQQNFSLRETIKVQLGSRGKDYTAVAGAMGVDLSWLDNVGITYSGSVNEQVCDLFLTPVLNNVSLFELIYMIDVKNGSMYMSIPDISEQYVGVNLGEEYDYERVQELLNKTYESYYKMMEACPSAEKMAQMAEKYYNIIMENVNNVEKSNGILEAGDVMEDCTLLTIELEDEDLKNILKAIYKELKKDEDVKEILFSSYRSLEMYTEEEIDEMYKSFQESMDEAIENLDSMTLDSVTIENYVNNAGKIVGRKLIMRGKDETVTCVYAIATKGDDKGYELSVKSSNSGFSIVGNGKEKGGKLDGEFVMTIDQKKLVNFEVRNYDVNALSEGRFSGTFIIKPGRDADLTDMIEELTDSMNDSPFASLVSSLKPSLRIKCDITTNEHFLEITILDDGNDLIGISFEGVMGEAREVAVPASYINLMDENGDFAEDEFINYVKGCNFDKVIGALEQAGLPEAWISLLNQYKGMLPMLLEYGIN